MGSTSSGKKIEDAFRGVPLPKGTEDIQVLSLRVNTETRSMRAKLLLPAILSYAKIEALKKALRVFYTLSEIRLDITFGVAFPKGERAALLRAFIIGALSEDKPIKVGS